MKSKKKLITLVMLLLALAFGTSENVQDEVKAGFSTMRGFTTLQESEPPSKYVTLASASFAELATTSLELIPAPGVGRVIQVLSVTGARVFASESWERNNSNLPTVGFENGAAITASLSAGLFTGILADTEASPSYQTLYPIDSRVSSNSAVVLRRTGIVEPTIDGDTSFKFFILYKTITLP